MPIYLSIHQRSIHPPRVHSSIHPPLWCHLHVCLPLYPALHPSPRLSTPCPSNFMRIQLSFKNVENSEMVIVMMFWGGAPGLLHPWPLNCRLCFCFFLQSLKPSPDVKYAVSLMKGLSITINSGFLILMAWPGNAFHWTIFSKKRVETRSITFLHFWFQTESNKPSPTEFTSVESWAFMSSVL